MYRLGAFHGYNFVRNKNNFLHNLVDFIKQAKKKGSKTKKSKSQKSKAKEKTPAVEENIVPEVIVKLDETEQPKLNELNG